MKTILKQSHEKILELYSTGRESFHLREIARKTKLNPNTTYTSLNELEMKKILTSRKDANLKKYGIARNNLAYSTLAQLSAAKLESLPEIRKSAIRMFSEKLKEKPIIALLFGSTAKGTTEETSDIDLLLIVNKRIEIKEAQSYADAQTGIRVNAIQMTYEDFKKEIKMKNDNLVQSAINTGYPITNQIGYYGMINDERV